MASNLGSTVGQVRAFDRKASSFLADQGDVEIPLLAQPQAEMIAMFTVGCASASKVHFPFSGLMVC